MQLTTVTFFFPLQKVPFVYKTSEGDEWFLPRYTEVARGETGTGTETGLLHLATSVCWPCVPA